MGFGSMRWSVVARFEASEFGVMASSFWMGVGQLGIASLRGLLQGFAHAIEFRYQFSIHSTQQGG